MKMTRAIGDVFKIRDIKLEVVEEHRKMINNPKRHRIETRGWCAKVHRQLKEYLQKVGNYNTLMPLVDFIGTAGEKYIINVSEGFDGKLDFDFVICFPATDNEWKVPLMARLNLPISIIKNIVRAFEQGEKDGNQAV